MLIDAGGEQNPPFDGKAALLAYLDAFFAARTDLHKRLDLLILSHPHRDHTLGACDVLKRYDVRHLVDDGLQKPSASGAVGQACLENAGEQVPYQPITVHDIDEAIGFTNDIIDPINCSQVDPKVRVLFGQVPAGSQDLLPDWTQSDANNENNQSIVTRIDFGAFSILVTGDLQERGIAELLQHSNGSNLLDVDVYEVGHHGSHNGTTAALVAAMSPKVAVMEMGDSRRHRTFSAFAFAHPNQQALALLTDPVHGVSGTRPAVTRAVGVKGTNPQTHAPPQWTTQTIDRAVYGTGWDGTIVIHADDAGHFDVFHER